MTLECVFYSFIKTSLYINLPYLQSSPFFPFYISYCCWPYIVFTFTYITNCIAMLTNSICCFHSDPKRSGVPCTIISPIISCSFPPQFYLLHHEKLCIFQHLKSLPHGICFVLGSLWEMSLRLSASLSFGAWASALVSPSVSCSSFFTWTIIWGVWTLGTMYSQSYFMNRLMHTFMAYLQGSLSITTFWNFLCAKYGWSNLLKPPLFCILPLILPKGPGTVDFASWRVPFTSENCVCLGLSLLASSRLTAPDNASLKTTDRVCIPVSHTPYCLQMIF